MLNDERKPVISRVGKEVSTFIDFEDVGKGGEEPADQEVKKGRVTDKAKFRNGITQHHRDEVSAIHCTIEAFKKLNNGIRFLIPNQKLLLVKV